MSQKGQVNSIVSPNGAIFTLTGDSGGAGSPTAGNMTIAGSYQVETTRSGSTISIAPNKNGFPITQYTSGPISSAGQVVAGYNSVTNVIVDLQGIIGPFFLAMQGGWYVEDINYSTSPYPLQLHMWGVVIASESNIQGTALQGQSTAQTNSELYWENIQFINTNSPGSLIIGDGGGGGTDNLLYYKNCNFQIQNGYILNLPNWGGGGKAVFDSCGLLGVDTTDGWMDTTGGQLDVIVKNSKLGSGTGKTAKLNNGTITLNDSTFNCPIDFGTGTTVIAKDCIFNKSITVSSNSTVQFINCSFNTGSSTALTMSSSGSVLLSNCTVNTSANPAIAGAGAGTLTINGISFIQNAIMAGTLTIASGSALSGGEIRAGADTGGATGFTSLTKSNSTTIGAGTGTVKMSNGNNANNAAWIKFYVGTTAYWVPAWTTNAP